MYMCRHMFCVPVYHTHTYPYICMRETSIECLMKIYIIYKWRHMYYGYRCITHTYTNTCVCVKCMLHSPNVYTTYMCKHISYLYLSIIHTYTNTYVHQYIHTPIHMYTDTYVQVKYLLHSTNVYITCMCKHIDCMHQTYRLYAPIHECSGEGLQHLLGAAKRAFSAR